MEQNQIHILKEKIKEHTAYRDHAEFKRKRSLYQDHFHDADNYEGERDNEQSIIDNLRLQLETLENNNRSKGTNFTICMDCSEKVHQRRIRNHKCKVTPAFMFNKRLYS